MRWSFYLNWVDLKKPREENHSKHPHSPTQCCLNTTTLMYHSTVLQHNITEGQAVQVLSTILYPPESRIWKLFFITWSCFMRSCFLRLKLFCIQLSFFPVEQLCFYSGSGFKSTKSYKLSFLQGVCFSLPKAVYLPWKLFFASGSCFSSLESVYLNVHGRYSCFFSCIGFFFQSFDIFFRIWELWPNLQIILSTCFLIVLFNSSCATCPCPSVVLMIYNVTFFSDDLNLFLLY